MLRRTCLLFIVVCSAVTAAEPAKHAIEIDDFFTLAAPSNPCLSPDGKYVAYLEARWQEQTDNRRNDIWLVGTHGDEPTRLTADRAGYAALRWGPDGKSLYCLCGRKGTNPTAAPFDGTQQVWRFSLGTADPIPITRVPKGIESFDVAASGEWVAYTTSSESDQAVWSKLRKDFSNLKYDADKSVTTTISKVDLKSWRSSEILKIPGAVDEFAISPDEKRMAIVWAPDARVITWEGKSKVSVGDIATGTISDLPDELWRAKAPSPFGRVQLPRWSADGKALAFAVGYDAYPSEAFVATFANPAKPVIHKVKRPGTVSFHGGVDGGAALSWRGSSHELCFLADDRARVPLYSVTDAMNPAAAAKPLIGGEVVVDEVNWDAQGEKAVVLLGKPDQMSELYLFENKQLRQLTHLRAHTASWDFPNLSVVRWKGGKGDDVEGILELPPSYQKGDKLPLVVNIHGGPTSVWTYNRMFTYFGSVLYAAKGYAYFSPNYHGSTGYGDKFMTDLVKHQNQLEVEDILLGVDHLINEGIVDRDRLAVSGWSNGGYLVNCLIAKTNRFKAASSGAGISNMTLEWGENDEPAYPMILIGGRPWEVPDEFQRTSPLLSFSKVKTPTIFHVGELDARCPKGNSESAFRALKYYLGVESELLIYPGEGHGLASMSSREAKMTWDLAWFDHYVRGHPLPAEH